MTSIAGADTVAILIARHNGAVNYVNCVWDMGGTLIDTYPAVDATLQRVAIMHGLQVARSEVALLTRVSIGSAMQELSARGGIALARFEEAYDDLKAAWATSPPPVMPGAREVMAHIHRLGGLNLVVTHRDRTSAQTLLDANQLSVDDMICAPDGHPRKPDPTMYHLIMERHGVDPARTLAIGDRPIDGRAAAAAGLETARLETPGIHLEPEDTYTVHSLGELKKLLARIQ